ncbi:MAG: sulfurtransferase [Xanthomonadales bacterium]|nr:sulfurtransferase [Xanthomonadales bacterium]
MPKSPAELVAEARARIAEVSVEALAAEAHGSYVLIDVREPGEFATAHIAGAIPIPRGVLEFQVEANPAIACVTEPALAVREQPIVLYCRTGGRSALAAESLQRLGFTRVRSLAGGITAWTAAGMPVTQH